MADQCSQTVFSGSRWDFGGHRCTRKAVVVESNKSWCRLHSPTAQRDAEIKREQKYKAERAASDRKYAKLAAERAVIEAALAWHRDGKAFALTDAVLALLELS